MLVMAIDRLPATFFFSVKSLLV